MIPSSSITAWRRNAPWPEDGQVEQDLVISRALVELFSSPELKGKLRFRGGTALNKLVFAEPVRFSEDIDLNRTELGPAKPVIDALRGAIEPWLGRAEYYAGPFNLRLQFRFKSEREGVLRRLKLELNVREIQVWDREATYPFHVTNPWFSGTADVESYSIEELLATKLRALLQRNKGRDLFDLRYALETIPNLDSEKVAALCQTYLTQGDTPVSRAQAEERLISKLEKGTPLGDIRPLLTASVAQGVDESYMRHSIAIVLDSLTVHFPGEVWKSTRELREEFGISPAQSPDP